MSNRTRRDRQATARLALITIPLLACIVFALSSLFGQLLGSETWAWLTQIASALMGTLGLLVGCVTLIFQISRRQVNLRNVITFGCLYILAIFVFLGSLVSLIEDVDNSDCQEMPASAIVEGLPSEWQFLSEVFSKYMNVFGVNIFATKDTPNSKVGHASNVLAQYLDNNADGTPDNPAVVNTMTQVNASIIMVSSEDDMECLIRRLPERFHEMMDRGQLEVQDLYWEETDPPDGFDASLEEVLHLISSVGYARTYPDVFGEEPASTIATYMDNARGGHFEERRDSDCEDDEQNEDWEVGQCALPPNGEYPEDAWYTYLDPTCDYACMVTEYFYWALTALLQAQSDNHRCNDIADEWVLCTNKQVKSRDPDIYTLLTDSQYALPTKLPDGNYAPSLP